MSEATRAQELAARLRRDILRGALAPGTPVKERDHAALLGVSRTPMREAIRILAQEGLLQLRPTRSPVVANPTVKEVTDNLTVMVALETLSGRLACAAASEAEIAEIEDIHARMAEGFDRMSPIDTFETDMAFHRAIARASHNDALAETHSEFMARLWRSRFLTAKQRRNRERVLDQHSAILRALRARDPAAIARDMELHLNGFSDSIEEVLAENGAPSAIPTAP